MSRLIKWIFFHSVFALCIYFGLFENVDGAKNVAIFMTWFTFVISLFALHDDVIKAIKEKGLSVPVFVDILFDIGVIFALVWTGWIITAIFYAIHIMIMIHARDKAFGEKP